MWNSAYTEKDHFCFYKNSTNQTFTFISSKTEIPEINFAETQDALWQSNMKLVWQYSIKSL